MSFHFGEPMFESGAKRTRSTLSGFHTKRPINKSLIAVQQAGNTATDKSSTLFATTFPCTITGLRWDIAFTQDGGTGTAFIHWAIIIVRAGVTQDTLSITDGASFFDPESNCLVFGADTIANNVESKHHSGSTKTMRKMQGGDSLIFVAKGSATNTSRADGVIQFFCKT